MSAGPQVSARQKAAGNIALALGISVWATHFLVTDDLLQTWDPYFVTTGRLLSAMLFLMTAYLIQSGGHPFRSIPSLRAAFFLGTVGMMGSTIALTLGVKYSGAVPAAIVAASEPIVAAFLARFLFRMPLGLSVILGAVVAVTGGIFATIGTSGEKLSELRGGELLILLGLCLFNWYAIGAQRWMTGVSQLGIAAITVAISAIAMTVALPFLILTGISEVQYSLDGRSIAYVLYLGAGPAAFALFCWHWGVSRCGVTVAAIYTNLAPIVVVTIRMIEGEPPKTEHLIGGGLIIAGVLIAQLMPAVPGRRQTREAT